MNGHCETHNNCIILNRIAIYLIPPMELLRNPLQLSTKLYKSLLRLVRFTLVVAVIYFLYQYFFEELFDGSNELYPLIGIWIFSAYFVIPRIHRILSRFYVPNYFVGRTRTADGLLSDPVNLAFFGTHKPLHTTMENAAWHKVEKLLHKNSVRMLKSHIPRQR